MKADDVWVVHRGNECDLFEKRGGISLPHVYRLSQVDGSRASILNFMRVGPRRPSELFQVLKKVFRPLLIGKFAPKFLYGA